MSTHACGKPLVLLCLVFSVLPTSSMCISIYFVDLRCFPFVDLSSRVLILFLHNSGFALRHATTLELWWSGSALADGWVENWHPGRRNRMHIWHRLSAQRSAIALGASSSSVVMAPASAAWLHRTCCVKKTDSVAKRPTKA